MMPTQATSRPERVIVTEKCARCLQPIKQALACYRRNDNKYFHPECWDKRNDPEKEKTMDDKRRFYVVRLGNGYVKHSQSLDGAADDWQLLEVTLAVNSLDAIKYEHEEAAQAMATSVGGEVCCFGIYDAKTTTKDPVLGDVAVGTSSGHGFDWALRRLKYREGNRVQRQGWNGKGMWIAVQVTEDNSKMTLPYIYFRTTTGAIVPWSPSQADMLHHDWVAVDEGAV